MTIIIIWIENSLIVAFCFHILKLGFCILFWMQHEDTCKIFFYAVVHSNHYSVHLTRRISCSDNMQFQCSSFTTWFTVYMYPFGKWFAEVFTSKIKFHFCMATSLLIWENRRQTKFSCLQFSSVNQNHHTRLEGVAFALYHTTESVQTSSVHSWIFLVL